MPNPPAGAETAMIREATVDDAAAIARIYRASKAESTPELMAELDRDPARIVERWRSYIAEGSRAQMATGDGFVLIAEKAGRPIGFAAFHHTRRHGCQAELQALYVLKPSQGQGVGTALLRDVACRLAHAQDTEGAVSMCVGYDPRNTYMRFYLRHGAVEIDAHWAYWPDVGAICR